MKAKNPSLKIVVGKLYRSKAGNMVRIYATDLPQNSCHGAVMINLTWVQKTFFSYGGLCHQDAINDIAAEWRYGDDIPWHFLPKEARYAAMHFDKTWSWFVNRPEYFEHGVWSSGVNSPNEYGLFYPSHTPFSKGLLPKDSLVFRP